MKKSVVNPAVFQMGISNDVYEPSSGKPSKTVPGMVLSLEAMLRRYVVNPESVPVRQGVYLGEADFPPVERMDATERLDAAKNIREGIAQFQARRAPKQVKPDQPVRKEPESTDPLIGQE